MRCGDDLEAQTRALPLQKETEEALLKQAEKEKEKEKEKETADEMATLVEDSDKEGEAQKDKSRNARRSVNTGSTKGSSRGSGVIKKPLKTKTIPAFDSDDEAEVSESVRRRGVCLLAYPLSTSGDTEDGHRNAVDSLGR